MASRSNKKKLNNNKITYSKEYESAKINREKVHNSLPFIMLISLLIIGICFLMPLTGLKVKFDLNASTDTTADTEPNYLTLSSSVNSFSIIYTGIAQKEDWLAFLSKNLIRKDDNSISEGTQQSVIDTATKQTTDSQKKLLDNVMWMQFYISIILVILWLSLIIVSTILIYKKKNILPILVLSLTLSVVSIVEFMTLVITALGNMAGSSFMVNVGAYLLPLICLITSALLLKAFIDLRKCNKLISQEEEKLNEKMSSLQ